MTLSSGYKKWHKPNQSDNARTFQGYYHVTNKEKYVGDPNLIIYRSGWEFSFCKFCDYSPSIIKWSAEPLSISYLDPTAKLEECKKFSLNPNDPKNWVKKQYHIDFWIMLKKQNETIEKWFIEIKPSQKLIKPKPPSKDSSLKIQRRFVNEAKEYLINESKWKAMNEYANKVGAKFFVFTEIQLEKLLGKFFYEKPSN